MNFGGHAAGGLLSSAAFVGGMHFFGALSLDGPWLVEREGASRPAENAVLAVQVFALCFSMSLFPDLDTDSIFRRWFYRALLVAGFLLIWRDRPELAAWLLMAGLFPLLDKHRGWTHWKISPLITSLSLPFLVGLHLAEGWQGVVELGRDYWAHFKRLFPFVSAIFFGHATHLLLDSSLFTPFRSR